MVWFNVSHVGINATSMTKTMRKNMLELVEKNVTSKMGKYSVITRFEEAINPTEFGMKVTGHQNST